MDKLLKELRKLMDSIKEYKGLDAEGRTEERRTQNTEEMARYKQVEKDIAELEEIEAMEARHQDPVDDSPIQSRVVIEDQPVYRTMFPLGEQMRDIRLACSHGVDYDVRKGAESRLQQVEKRAVEHHGIVNVEDRAAGDGMDEGAGADGAFLLQGESAQDLFSKGFNNNAVLSRTSNRTIKSAFLDLLRIKEDSRADGSRNGGISVYTSAELEAMTATKTQFEKTRIEPKKLTGMYYASDEILEDIPALQGEMGALIGEEFQYKGQALVLGGSGSGEPLGIKNADCMISVPKVTSQTAATVNATNISAMFARVSMRSLGSLVWLVNQDVSPSLDALAYATTATNTAIYVPITNPSLGSIGTLKGLPVIPVEQCETLGTAGDIILCDLSQYITANKGGINSAMSIHLKFEVNQTAFRFTYRFDGQPRWKSALTPAKGSKTVSPFVKLAVRS